MTQEEKELLLKVFCAMLPYRLLCYVPTYDDDMELTGVRLNYLCFHKREWGINYKHELEIVIDPLNDSSNSYVVKPYLRPLSSMTEEEICDYMKLRFEDSVDVRNAKHTSNNSISAIVDCTFTRYWYNEMVTDRTIDWLNKKKFDWRGLIPLGLGIDCTGLNIY